MKSNMGQIIINILKLFRQSYIVYKTILSRVSFVSNKQLVKVKSNRSIAM